VILDEIAAKTRMRLVRAKEAFPFERVRDAALAKAAAERSSGGPDFPFEKALSAPGVSFICEVKKASPSKGIIAGDFPYLRIAEEYEAAGAEAVSVLTEPDFFLGSDVYLRDIAAAVKIPVLRKDFVIDPYQIYEAKCLGAHAALLICALLDRETLADYLTIARELGLSCLTEAHTETEVEMAADAGARIIGINNRDLKTFQVDLGVTRRLRELIPPDRLAVSESGIGSPEDIRALPRIDGVLIGETLMRAADKKRRLAELRGDELPRGAAEEAGNGED
jgi:indole-3-glycerol phosphate synthase